METERILLRPWLESDAEVLFNWIFHITNIFNLLLIGLFGWLSWRRLNRMAY